MSAVLAPVLKFREFDSNGDPLAGGKLYSYLAGTSTPAATYLDQAGITPNTNPIILDANGVASLWLPTGSFKLILTDSADVEQWSVDNVSISDSAASSSPWVSFAVTDGMAATSVTGATVNFASYSSAFFDIEIIRGTTVIASGPIAIQNLNGTGRVCDGLFMCDEVHGVTWTVVNSSAQIWQLKAATSAGPGAGTIKYYRRLVPN